MRYAARMNLTCAAVLLSTTAVATNAIQASGAIVLSEFIYESAPFPSAHASTIVETPDGLVAAWFGGTAERNPDVGIWVSRHDGGRWSAPVEVASGVQPDGTRHPCWNPVLFQPPAGPLVLFYKVGPSPRAWWGMARASSDGGRTWSEAAKLPDGILGPIRAKPVLLPDGTLLAGSSTEHAGWVVHMERFKGDTQLFRGDRTKKLSVPMTIESLADPKSWQKSGPLNDPKEFGAIQPTILVHSPARLQILTRSQQQVITEAWSEDGGRTWGRMTATPLANPSAGIDAVRLRDGRFALVYNPTARGRERLEIAISTDGKAWTRGVELENSPGEYSYPAMIQTRDGLIHVTYTWQRRRIRHAVIDPKLMPGSKDPGLQVPVIAGSKDPALRHAALRQAATSVTNLRTEYMQDPLGIDARKPRLSWQLRADRRGVAQTAYQVRVARSEADLQSARRLVWDSGRIATSDSIHRVYGGPVLESGQRYFWSVRVWDEAGTESAWSVPAHWEMGLLNASDWRAEWIEPGLPDDVSKPGPVPMLRREFRLAGPVARARAYVTSHGVYEMHLNGRRVGDQVLAPGWTSYKKRLQYQTYDVTDLLQAGHNAVGVLLGNGWYRGEIGFSGQRNFYGDRVALLVQIAVTYRNGRQEIVGSDASWKASTGPILMSEIYHGETYDARLERSGWTQPGFDDGQWTGVRAAGHTTETLLAPAGPPVRRMEELRPVKVFKTPGGDTVIDMGQNMVGWLRLKVRGPAGSTVTLRHAEVLDRQGNFYTENLRRAQQTLRYTLKGGQEETFEPHFTFMGFRYVAVDGYPGELTTDSLTGVVVYSAMPPTGELDTSSAPVNQLQRNIVWGQRGNFLDVPTDCPQRDERLGWTGDAQVFCRTAAFNMDVAGFFTKWVKDVEADQLPNGSVPHVIPDVLSNQKRPQAGAAGWADAAVIIPWTMYLAYGDTRILEEQYASMARWVDYMRARAGDDHVWTGDFHFGDWLAFASTSAAYPGATTGTDLIATAFYAHSTDLLRRISLVLGKEAEAARYADQLAKIKSAFRREFVTDTGRVGENTQTAYVLALEFDLLPDDLRPIAAKRLADEVRSRRHLTTGFLGTPYLCHVLARHGYLSEAYALLEREDYPSWLYPVKQGATTIWERWDGRKPDGSFQDRGMNSFNHYAYGAIGDWMYRVMAGIELDAAAPGYKHVRIQPQPGGRFTGVKASYKTMHGTVSSAWSIKEGTFDLSIEVPANTRATVRLPNARLATVTESGRPVAGASGIARARQEGDAVTLEVGSGSYRFAYPFPSPPPAS
jgi:alpha-L-rhamnosidase